MDIENKENETPTNEEQTSNDETTSTNEEETSKTEDDTSKTDEIERLKEETRKAKELADNYKVRAEKAEKVSKDKPKEQSLSQKDLLAVLKANIPEEDIDEVINYASFKKISVSDAIKDKFMTSFLKEKAEERKTAEASNTARGMRKEPKIKGEEVLARTRLGQLPDTDEEIDASINAYFKQKRGKDIK